MSVRKIKKQLKKERFMTFYEYYLDINRYTGGRPKKFPYVKYARATYKESERNK